MDINSLKDNRYFGAVVLVPILLAFLAGGTYLKIVVTLMAFRALYEYMEVVKEKGIYLQREIVYIAAGILFSLFIFGYASLKVISVVILFTTTVSLIHAVFSKDHSINDSSMTILGFIYCCSYFALILLIDGMTGGTWYVFSIFTIAWGCDTSAYYGGRFFGKRKLIPEVSPKKTVEGAIIGALGGSLITFIFSIIIIEIGINYVMSPIHFLIMGFLGSIFSQVGDLIASVIKRDAGVKDYPKLIPGHGGILDRFDSVLMSAVAVFMYLTIVLGY